MGLVVVFGDGFVISNARVVWQKLERQKASATRRF